MWGYGPCATMCENINKVWCSYIEKMNHVDCTGSITNSKDQHFVLVCDVAEMIKIRMYQLSFIFLITE